jgi:hypothetical protein
MPPVYDDGESFTAGDDDPGTRHFDNDKLIALLAVVAALVDDEPLRDLVRLAILRAIFGEAEDR